MFLVFCCLISLCLSSCPNNCSGHGACMSDSVCVCSQGFYGKSCELAGCIDNCNGHGYCHIGEHENTCVCFPGFNGTSCQHSNETKAVIPSSPMTEELESNELNCSSDTNTTNTTDEYCPLETPSECENNCNKHGKCVNSTCVCDLGYVGVHCETETCAYNCNDRGKCVLNTTSNSHRCDCSPGWEGSACETIACVNQCSGNGKCVDGFCYCTPGFYDIDCSKKIDEEYCNCGRNGFCKGGKCYCKPGFNGKSCAFSVQTMFCGANCTGNGRCVNDRCDCDSGWIGEFCQVKQCKNDCSGNGKCTDGICECFAYYYGESCELRYCDNHCSGNGLCKTTPPSRCWCNDGWEGSACNVRSSGRNRDELRVKYGTKSLQELNSEKSLDLQKFVSGKTKESLKSKEEKPETIKNMWDHFFHHLQRFG